MRSIGMNKDGINNHLYSSNIGTVFLVLFLDHSSYGSVSLDQVFALRGSREFK